jgi:hypothetical protein
MPAPTGKPLTKKTRALALAAGAQTDREFALYANLVGACKTFKKELGKINKIEMPIVVQQFRGMILRYTFLLERGRFFEAQPLPKGFKRKKAKECYGNSFTLATSRRGLAYCEGIVVTEFGNERSTDIDHGWCVTEDGKVIDVTLEKPGLAYFGAIYAKEELIDVDFLPLVYRIVEKHLDEEMQNQE